MDRSASRRVRAFATLLLVALFATVLGARPASADNGPDGERSTTTINNNIAEAIATDDGSSVFRLAFSIQKTSSDVVDPGNLALAYSKCTDCRALAMAVQIVFVEGSPSTFTPENAAVAVNDHCTGCRTAALAYQIVMQVPDGFELSREAGKQLYKLSAQMARIGKDFEKGKIAFEDAIAQLEALADQVKLVVQQEVAAAAERAKQQEGQHSAETAPAAASSSTTSSSSTSTTVQQTTTTSSGTTSTSTTAVP